jgi:hypothetical protein
LTTAFVFVKGVKRLSFYPFFIGTAFYAAL